MDLSYKTNTVFPIPIHQFDVNGFDKIQNELVDYAYDLKEKDPEGNLLSNRGGWQSKGFDVNDENDKLHQFIINCLSKFPYIKISVKIFLHGWININKPGDYNVKHSHPSNDLSGVIWLNAPKDSGKIVFESPFNFNAYNEITSYTDDFKNNFNIDESYYFNPISGRILVFPSHLQHEVLENKSNEDRISVSFNIRLR